MIKGLETLGDIQTPLNVMLENLAETIADKVVARIKEEDSNSSPYFENCGDIVPLFVVTTLFSGVTRK